VHGWIPKTYFSARAAFLSIAPSSANGYYATERQLRKTQTVQTRRHSVVSLYKFAITHADDSRGSNVCVSCLFVCMTELKQLKLQSPNLPEGYSIMSPVGYPFNIRSIGQRSQGHKVQKHILGDLVARVSLSSSSSSSYRICIAPITEKKNIGASKS